MAESNVKVQLTRASIKFSKRADEVVREVLLAISARILELSPVGDPTLWRRPRERSGYVGGRFKNNWQYGNNKMGVPKGTLFEVDPTGDLALGRISAGIPSNGAVGLIHTLTNNLPYAVALENGFSTQAPSGMLGLVAQEFPAIVDRAVEEVRGSER